MVLQQVMSWPSIELDTVSVRGLTLNSYELMENCSFHQTISGHLIGKKHEYSLSGCLRPQQSMSQVSFHWQMVESSSWTRLMKFRAFNNWIISSASHIKEFLNKHDRSKSYHWDRQLQCVFQLVMSGPSIERDTLSVRGLTVISYELMENCQFSPNNFWAPSR